MCPIVNVFAVGVAVRQASLPNCWGECLFQKASPPEKANGYELLQQARAEPYGSARSLFQYLRHLGEHIVDEDTVSLGGVIDKHMRLSMIPTVLYVIR